MLDHVLEVMSRILERDPSDCNNVEKNIIQEALGQITGANNRSYVRPDPADDAMAKGFVAAFEQQKKELQTNDYIWVECDLWKQVKRHQRQWWESETSGATTLELFEDLDISLVTTNSGRRIIVVPSFFKAFAPEKCERHVRIRLVKSLIAFLDLLQRIGLHDRDYVTSFRKVLVSFLMSLEFGNNDDDEQNLELPNHSAARWTMPKEYMRPPLPNSLTVSNSMGVNVWHQLYLQFRLGTNKFRNLLRHMDILHDDETHFPSHPDWKCPGVPASPKIPAQACNCDANDIERFACMVGQEVGKGVHVFYGRFVCRKCHRKMQCRELDELSSREDLTVAQAKRLSDLQGMTSTQYRKRKIQQVGLEVVRQTETLQRRKNGRTDTETRKARNKQRDAQREIASKEKRYIGGKKKAGTPYPPYVMERLRNASIDFFIKAQVETVPWITLQKVYVAILEAHWDKFPPEVTNDGRTPKENKIRYRREQFRIASSKFLEPTVAIDIEDDKWFHSKLRVKPKYQNKITSVSKTKFYDEIYREIAQVEFVPQNV